jgi:hypothetical protein
MKYKAEYEKVVNQNRDAQITLLQSRDKFKQGCTVVELMLEIDKAIEQLK